MKRNISLLLSTFLSITMFAQHYEGERNKKGEPHGQGVMFFDNVDNTYNEKLEGTFKNGIPQKGKSYRYYKESGRLQMIFEGKFKIKEKSVLRKLSDLNATGDIVSYFYEDSKNYNDRGYQVKWGKYDNGFLKGCMLFCKKKKIRYVEGNNFTSKEKEMTPEAQKFYNELYSHVGSAWIFDRKPEFDRIHVTRKIDSFIKLNNIHWAGSVKNGFLDGKGDGYLSTTSDNGGSLDYTFEGEFREGVPVNVTISRKYYWDKNGWINSREDKSSIRVTTGDLRNNMRPFKVESISGKSKWQLDTSYEGFVDGNFQFKSDYAENAEKEQVEKQNKAWGALFNAVGKTVGGTLAVAEKIAPGSNGNSANNVIELETNKCKAPSGKLILTDLLDLFGTGDYKHENDGKLYFRYKNKSTWVSYNIIYDNDKEFQYYHAWNSGISNGFIPDKKCKTYDEMINNIYEAINKGYLKIDE